MHYVRIGVATIWNQGRVFRVLQRQVRRDGRRPFDTFGVYRAL